MIRGICHWFCRVNENDKNGLRKCRNGSLCRYRHLTREEAEQIIQHGNQMEDCMSCNGTGQIYIRHHDFHMQCPQCDGKRQLTVRQQILRKAENREWCDCKEDERDIDTWFFDDGRHPKCKKHCYVCKQCKGITQVG